MKKLFISAFAMLAVALGFTACSSDDELVNETSAQGKKVTVIASTEEPGQRTALQQDGDVYKVVWSEGDKIKIDVNEFTLTSTPGSSTGEFTGTVPKENGDAFAYYPSTYDGSTWPTAQTYEENSIPQGVPMRASNIPVKNGVLDPISFKNEGGILRLNLKGTAKVTSITVSATELTNPITLDCESGVLLTSEGVPFHIAVPGADAPGTAYSGLKIEITDNTGAVCIKTLKSDKTITVQRSMITDITLNANSFVTPDYLCFTAVAAGATIDMKNFSMSDPSVKYSTDKIHWTPFTIGTTEVKLENAGDKVYFKGINPSGFSTTNEKYTKFVISGTVAASGNVMSLIDPSCATTEIPCDYCFFNLFRDCAGLTTAPELPATTLKDRCYKMMFNNCTSLTAAPELKATTLVYQCYEQMFYGCTKLNSVTCLATAFSVDEKDNWLYDVATTGTFTKATGVVWSSGASGIPSGWTVVEKE